MKLTLDWKKGIDLFFMDRVQRRATRITQLLLAILLAASLAQFTWKLWPVPQEALAPAPARLDSNAGQAGPGAAGPADRPQDVAQLHLFGIKPAGRMGAPVVAALPETKLNLSLRGIVAGATAADSGAIIGAPNGVEAFYGIDSELPGAAVLKEVYSDRVVLERNGQLETLRLPREALGDSGGAAGPPAAGPATPPGPGAGGDVNSGASLQEYRQQLLADPQRLNELVQIAPRNEGGRFIGYELRPGRDSGLLNRLGLAPGDVVTSVNGIALNTPAKAMEVIRTLSEANQLQVTVERNGVPQSLTIDMKGAP